MAGYALEVVRSIPVHHLLCVVLTPKHSLIEDTKRSCTLPHMMCYVVMYEPAYHNQSGDCLIKRNMEIHMQRVVTGFNIALQF